MGVNATYRGNKVALWIEILNVYIVRIFLGHIVAPSAVCFKKKKLIEVRPSPIFQPTPGGKFERNKREQKRKKEKTINDSIDPTVIRRNKHISLMVN